MSLAERLPSIWYGGAPVPVWLRGLVPVYRLLRALARAPYTLRVRKPTKLPVPVIVVGNISAGGTGKTPVVIALVEALRARGWQPGIISRGYGRSGTQTLVLDDRADANSVGDEPLLIRSATAAPVAVGRDRVAAGQLLLATSRCNVLIADDGLQHCALFRNVEICVIDGERRFGNGLLLPAGPLREPVMRLDCCDFRICNGGVAGAREVPMQLTGDTAIALTDPAQRRSLRDFAGVPVHAVAGIGNPQRFFGQLRAAGLHLIEHAFPDHHAYSSADLVFNDALPVLMTAKDAVKCAAFAQAHWWQLPVRAQLPGDFYDAVAARLG